MTKPAKPHSDTDEGAVFWSSKIKVVSYGFMIILTVSVVLFPAMMKYGQPYIANLIEIQKTIKRSIINRKYMRVHCQRHRDNGDKSIDCSKL